MPIELYFKSKLNCYLLRERVEGTLITLQLLYLYVSNVLDCYSTVLALEKDPLRGKERQSRMGIG